MTRTRSKAARLHELRDLLRLRPRRVTDLAAQFGVSRRTIERDLNDLAELEPLESDGAEYYLKHSPVQLNPVEALAVHSATRLLVHHAQINEANYRTALEKLARSLPEPARGSAHRSVDQLAERSSVNSRLLDQVAQAWFERRVLLFDYLSLGSTSGKPRAQQLEVYFFEISRTNLAAYVLGYERGWHKAVRIYKLDRMTNLRLANGPDASYDIPGDFDPLEFLSGAWGIVVGDPITVHLRFSAAVAGQLQELPPHNLELSEPAADGSIEVKARAGSAPGGLPYDLLAWIRSWGSEVEVLAPDNVREHVVADLRRSLAAYN